MKTSLIFSDISNSRFFQKIAFDASSLDGVIRTEINLSIFAKSTWILISYCFTISKCLQNRIASQYLALNRQLMILFMTQICEHLHTILSWLCLACPRFTRNNNGLFFNLIDHSLKSSSSNSINMRKFNTISLKHSLSYGFDDIRIKKVGHFFIRIERDKSRSYGSIDLILLVPLNQVAEDVLFFEFSHKTHVLMSSFAI